MSLLSNVQIKQLLSLSQPNKRLVITPLLEVDNQIGECTIDLRLGSKFKVDMKTREPYFDVVETGRPIETFYDETYRAFGEKFLLYPNQLVIASTFEYVRLPENLFGLVVTRSSWNRLGLRISSIVQPGYAGVLTLELMNNSSNPIALYPGLRFVQLSLLALEESGYQQNTSSYISQTVSKYIANSEPHLSGLRSDEDLEILRNKF